jgi:nitrogen regulatory protein PII
MKRMKAVMIVFNQTHTERVEFILEQLGIRGFTWWNDVRGRGSETGEPRMGTHTWPEMNSAALVITEDEKVRPLLESIGKMDEINREIGVRAFVWDILESL